MSKASRVENDCPTLLLPSPKGVIGLTTLNQYIYVFFPQKIRVYEQLPSRLNPEIVENICRFAVSQQYIAILFEDSAFEVRLRQYWEVVQYSSYLKQPSSAIDSLEIDTNKVYYRFKREEDEHPTFGFVDLSDKAQEIQYWQQNKPLQKLIHRHKLGSIPDFYVSLLQNQIKFGMYYQEQPTLLKEFQFGSLKQTQPETKVLSVHLLQSQEIRRESQSQKKDLFLVKLVEESESKKQHKQMQKKKNKNKEKEKVHPPSIVAHEGLRRLKLKYIKFFEEEMHDPVEESTITNEQKKFKIFEEMLYSMQQIQTNTNCEKSDFFGNFNSQSSATTSETPQVMAKSKDQWKSLDLMIQNDEIDSFTIIKKGSILYLTTDHKLLSFCFKEGPTLELIQQFAKDSDYYKIKDVCQHGLILYGQSLFTMPFAGQIRSSEEEAQKFENQQRPKDDEIMQKEFAKEKSNSSSGSKQERKEQGNQLKKQSEKYQGKQSGKEPEKSQGKQSDQNILDSDKKTVIQASMQTEVPTDVYLDQYEEQQLAEIIDKLFQKKKVSDQETETQRVSVSTFQVQAEGVQQFTEKMKAKPEFSDQQTQSQQKTDIQQDKNNTEIAIEPIIGICHQQVQVNQQKLESKQIGTGQCLPLCPSCHEASLDSISKSLKKIEDNSGQKWVKVAKEGMKNEYQKLKNDVLAKIKTIVGSVVGGQVVSILENSIKPILDQKLQQMNSYMYSLVMSNLMTLNQELEKDVARQNGIRNELLKKQMHEINESKKAVTQMVQICKEKQIQKNVFFQNISNKFKDIEVKVIGLQEKMIKLAKAEQEKDISLETEIEAIRALLIEDKKQEEKSIESESQSESEKESESESEEVVEEREQKTDSRQQEEQVDESFEEEESSEEDDSSQEEGVDINAWHHYQRQILAMQSRFMAPQYPPPVQQQQYWQPQPLPYPYFPQQFQPYPQPYMQPSYPQSYPPASYPPLQSPQPPLPQFTMPKPSKKLQYPANEQASGYSFPMNPIKRTHEVPKKKQKNKQ